MLYHISLTGKRLPFTPGEPTSPEIAEDIRARLLTGVAANGARFSSLNHRRPDKVRNRVAEPREPEAARRDGEH